MKILMLGWELPPHNSGGLGVACYYMAKALAQEGVEIDFVVPYSAPHDEIDFMTIHAATKLGPLHKNGWFGAYDSSQLTECYGDDACENEGLTDMRHVQKRYIKFVERLAKSGIQPDVIHAHDWLTMEAGMRAKELTGAPLIVHVHATEFDRAGAAEGNPLVHDIEYQGLMMADRIFAVSQITKNLIVQRYQIPPEKIEVVYNAIDAEKLAGYEYDRRSYRYLEALKVEGYTVVSTVTRFTIQKGLTHFLKAAAIALHHHDKLVFLLAGDGEQRDELIKLAADLRISDKIIFTGFVRGKQWRDAYSVSDIFVMSSVSEPFGLTALEAAHHDTALIITKQSGVSEVLDSIYTYDFWDTELLARQIVEIAESPELQNRLKSGVKQEYARISWHDIARQCLASYHSVRKEARS